MTDPTNNLNSADPDQEMLVAYLDGEVDADVAKAVEERLARDADFRKTLNQLERSWDLLNDLPQPTIDEAFTKTTVEMVAVQMSQEVEKEQSSATRKKQLWPLFTIAIVLACLPLGFLARRHFLESPDEQLIEDLPVIERVDVYQHIDDLHFLEQLNSEGLFDEHPDQ